MECSKCQSKNPEGINFCGNCGAPLNVHVCPTCNHENPSSFRFCGNCGQTLAVEQPTEHEPESAAGEQERRQLTVLFCDLVDSTRLSRLMDPEDLLAIIQAYQEVCTRHINYYGGTVARFIGDGILAYFGYPQAHEDDAERAIQAGLRIIEDVPNLNGQFNNPEEVPIAVRLGTATGLTVVGDIVGPNASELQSATGETPNLAARMQSLAQPNSLVIPMNTMKLVGGLFHYEDLGYHELKGFDRPIKAWRVLGVSLSESRFEATHSATNLPMVNREEEIEVLQRRWESACRGKGNVVMLAGEAGIGKSRLIQILVDGMSREKSNRLGFQCYPYYTNSPYYPLLRSLQIRAGLSTEKPLRNNVARLRRILVGEASSKTEVIEAIAPLFTDSSASFDNVGSEVPQGIDKVRLHRALIDQIRQMTSQTPVFVLIEDLHWIDPSSEELLDELIENISGLSCLCVLTFRPQYKPRWIGQPETTLISLNRLDQEYRRELVNNVCREREIPDRLVDLIADKTDGVPLFVEEVTKTLLDSGETEIKEEDSDETVIQRLSIPTSLQDSLIARLDQLAPVKEVAQVASVIGREASRDLLEKVLGWESDKLEEAISQLVSADLMLQHGSGKDARYEFRHGLIQDAAYEGMLRKKRARLHLKVVLVLEELFVSVAQSEPEILAHHLEEAARPDHDAELLTKSAGHWLEAGLRSSRQSAFRESEKQLRRGISVIQQCDDDPIHQRLERDLQTALGNVLIQNEGPGSAAVSEAFARAAELSLGGHEDASDSVREFAIKWGQWRTCFDIPNSKHIVDEMLEIASAGNNPDLLLEAYHAQWPTFYYLGDLDHCCNAVDQGLTIYQEDRHGEHRAFFGGHDTRVCGHGQAALAYWLSGRTDQSESHIEAALKRAHECDHKPSVAHALDYEVMLSYMMGDKERTRKAATELHVLSSEQRFPDYIGRARTFLGWCHVHDGSISEGMHELESGLAEQQQVGTQEDFEVFLGMHAECLVQGGEIEKAISEYREALAQASERSMCFWQGELSRRIAGLAHQLGDEELCGSSLRKAISLSESQRAYNLLLHALKDFQELFPEGVAEISAALKLIQDETPWLLEQPDFHEMAAILKSNSEGTDA